MAGCANSDIKIAADDKRRADQPPSSAEPAQAKKARVWSRYGNGRVQDELQKLAPNTGLLRELNDLIAEYDSLWSHRWDLFEVLGYSDEFLRSLGRDGIPESPPLFLSGTPFFQKSYDWPLQVDRGDYIIEAKLHAESISEQRRRLDVSVLGPFTREEYISFLWEHDHIEYRAKATSSDQHQPNYMFYAASVLDSNGRWIAHRSWTMTDAKEQSRYSPVFSSNNRQFVPSHVRPFYASRSRIVGFFGDDLPVPAKIPDYLSTMSIMWEWMKSILHFPRFLKRVLPGNGPPGAGYHMQFSVQVEEMQAGPLKALVAYSDWMRPDHLLKTRHVRALGEWRDRLTGDDAKTENWIFFTINCTPSGSRDNWVFRRWTTLNELIASRANRTRLRVWKSYPIAQRERVQKRVEANAPTGIVFTE